MLKSEGALSQVRILDLSDEKSIYGAKMLADLGAQILRPEPVDGDPLRKRGPFDDATCKSLWYTFFASSRTFFRLDGKSHEGTVRVNELATRANVVLVSPDNDFAQLLDIERALAAEPQPSDCALFSISRRRSLEGLSST